MRKSCFIILFLSLSVSLSMAQSLITYRLSAPLGSGARAMGMGGSFIAIADDATAITWNPGGLAQIEEIEISTVASYYDFQKLWATTVFGDQLWGPGCWRFTSEALDFIGITVPLRPIPSSDFKVVMQYSYQKLINLNMKFDQPPAYFKITRIQNNNTIISEGYRSLEYDIDGGLNAHSLGLGFSVGSWLDIGLSTNIWTNGFSARYYDKSEFVRTNTSTGESVPRVIETTTTDEGYYSGTSFNVGALFHITDQLNLGAVYKASFTYDIDDSNDELIAKVTYPASYGVGISYRPIDNLTIAADLTATEWSKGKLVSGDAEFYYPNKNLVYDPSNDDPRLVQHNNSQFRIGTEYIFVTESLLIALRGGVF